MESKKRTLDLREPPCQNPLVKLMKMDQLAEQTQMIHIGIDGYYGNDAFLTLQTMQLAKEKVRKVVIERFHVTDFSRVVWVCPLGSWMKCLPLFLIADGLGHHIEFIAPTGDIIATDQGLHISGKNGYTVKNSIELMDDRLNESESRSLCNVPPTFQIISDMLKKSKAFIHKTEAWKEQTEKLISLSEYAIVIPYYDPNTVQTVEEKNMMQNKHGGRLYNSKLNIKRELINLYDLIRESPLQINPVRTKEIKSCPTL